MIKLDRIENALSKIESHKKEGPLNQAKACLESVKEAIKEDPLSVQDALAALKDVFNTITEMDKNDHNKIFAEFDSSLQDAIVEHMQGHKKSCNYTTSNYCNN